MRQGIIVQYIFKAHACMKARCIITQAWALLLAYDFFRLEEKRNLNACVFKAI